MRKLLYSILFSAPFLCFGQARVVFNGAYMVMNGGTGATPIYLEVNNAAANALTRNSGWIVSESEFNMVKWDISASSGSYVVPFGYQTLDYLPVTADILTSGAPLTAGSGSIKFSTWHCAADNWAGGPVPSDVTNMDPVNIALSQPSTTDDSWWVVDRFWVLDANTGYAVKPSPNLKFTYINSGVGTEIASPNVLTEPNLIAQRFNSTLNTWGDYFGSVGTDVSAPPTGSCKNDAAAAITPANFFRSWTLSDITDPLPITLTSFNVNCVNNQAVITWTTQTETNNNYFTIERSPDGTHFQPLGTVNGAGNSSVPHSYSFTDPEPLPGTSYYRLSQTDYDGKTTPLPPVAFNGCSLNGTTIGAFYSASDNSITVRINAASPDNYNLMLVNALGQVIFRNVKSLPAGYNEFTLYPGRLSNAIYIIRIVGNKASYSRKFALGDYR